MWCLINPSQSSCGGMSRMSFACVLAKQLFARLSAIVGTLRLPFLGALSSCCCCSCCWCFCCCCCCCCLLLLLLLAAPAPLEAAKILSHVSRFGSGCGGKHRMLLPMCYKGGRQQHELEKLCTTSRMATATQRGPCSRAAEQRPEQSPN